MDAALAYEAGKTGAEMVTALAKLATEAKNSKNPSLQEILGKLKIEAINIARGLDKSLDGLQIDLINNKIDPKQSLRAVDEEIGWWNFGKKIAFRGHVRRLTRAAGAIKDLYSDVEAAFLCANEGTSVAMGVSLAYELRGTLHKQLNDDTPIGEIIGTLRKAVNDAEEVLKSA